VIPPRQVAILGASGAIGSALVANAAMMASVESVCALSRSPMAAASDKVDSIRLDGYTDTGLAAVRGQWQAQGFAPDLVIVASGLLHDAHTRPDKSFAQWSAEGFHRLFEANCVVPALAIKHLLPAMAVDRAGVFAALSARVGSISDNRLGGWTHYRAAKAALNMVIRNAAIETSRQPPAHVVIGLHPGTVDSDLSRPFQSTVDANRLFTADFAAARLLEVVASRESIHSGHCFDWKGELVPP
jgi:NAD(P)-dependent dehydrogenase (short-subunit alcohol dehydrogenase family)